MADQTNIEWCDSTFNPWIGCTKVSPACDHCYAAVSTPARTMAIEWGPGKTRHRTSAQNRKRPLKWNRAPFGECTACGWRGERRECITVSNPPGYHPPADSATACPQCREPTIKEARRRVFCSSLSDWLDNEVPIEWLIDLLDVIRQTPNLDWLLLTKRIGNFGSRLDKARRYCCEERRDLSVSVWNWMANGDAPPNVWLGATVVNQAEVDRDIPKLLSTPAAVRWISVEPMLGPIDLDYWPIYGPDREQMLNWVVCGGESGPAARPMHPDWARSLRDQCVTAGVPFLFKQWGEHAPNWMNDDDGDPIPGSEWIDRMGKRAAGRTLDGRTWSQWPEVSV